MSISGENLRCLIGRLKLNSLFYQINNHKVFHKQKISKSFYRPYRHIDSRFDKCWKPSEEDPYWPSYVFDKVRLYLERPRTQVRSENSIFDIVHNRTIH